MTTTTVDPIYQKRIDAAKRYIAENPEKHKLYMRRYLEKNREKLNKQRLERYHARKHELGKKMTCEVCGGSYTVLSKRIHLLTKKHTWALLHHTHNIDSDTIHIPPDNQI